MGAEEYTDDWHIEDAVVSGAQVRGGGQGSAVPTPTAGAVLRSTAAALGAAAVVQAGADSGVSGLYLLEGMSPDGVLTSIEENAESDAAARVLPRLSRRLRGSAPPWTGAPLDVLSRLTDHAYNLVVIGAGLGASAPYTRQPVGSCAQAALRSSSASSVTTFWWLTPRSGITRRWLPGTSSANSPRIPASSRRCFPWATAR